MRFLAIVLSVIGLHAADPIPHRFSTNHIDFTANPRQDFAKFAFGKWQKENPIPSDKERWGGFNELAEWNLRALHGILEEKSAAQNKRGSNEQLVADFYRSALDTNAIESAALKPLARDLRAIGKLKTPDDLARFIAHLHSNAASARGRGGISAVFELSVDADEKQSAAHALYLSQGGMSLPSKDYYTAPQFENIRTQFVAHVAKMFSLAGLQESDAPKVFEIEKALAANSKTPVELRDPIANYNKTNLADFAKSLRAFPFDLYLKERGISKNAAAEPVVRQPKFFEGLQELPADDWKPYLRYHLLRDSAPFLASKFDKEHFRFFGTVMNGTPEQEPRWKRATRATDKFLGEALGRFYVEKYYPPQARARMEEMIKNITAVMRERLEKLDWMTEPTRQKALAKFDRFVPQIGHPEKWRDYSSVKTSPRNFFENVRAAAAFEHKRDLAKLGNPVDKSEWFMSPPTVNAYFNPVANQITFPAGILQPPFFDFTLDDAVNYGAIGGVIGHEITHGFDDQGRRYDAEGNLTDWWTKEDADNFSARAAALVEQYNKYEALPGLKLNGALSLGENIADLGGTSIAFEAFQRSQAGKEQKKIDGLTPEQRFFLSWAQQWRTVYRDDALRRQVTVGPHSPGQFRATGPIVNHEAFHQAFAIKEGDPMFRKPEDRVKIW